MIATQESRKISDLLALRSSNMLRVNPEYQRGAVWNLTQKRKLIDSLLRGYPLPLIYLHHIKTTVAGMSREDLEVIDGQQRMNAIYEFSEGVFKLFDPIKDDSVARFPSFVKNQPCPWAGKDFHQLDDKLKEKLYETQLTVALIETKESSEVRDLFVRLQSGLALNNQETRDAWPGNFTDFILWLGGKPEVPRYQGHAFFRDTLGMKPGNDRGKTRQLAAQLVMLFMAHRQNPDGNLCDINSNAISDFYYENLDFDRNSFEATRLVKILDKLHEIFLGQKYSKMRAHDAIHIVLLVDSLMDDYAPDWADRLPSAIDQFSLAFAKSKIQSEDTAIQDEYWINYAQWTRVNSDRGEVINRRHIFYTKKMMEFLQPLKLKDPSRLFGIIERTILFHEQGKKCQVCGGSASWNDIEVHHVEPHSLGGQTSLDNGAVVHKQCHPKGPLQTASFAEKFYAMKTAGKQSV